MANLASRRSHWILTAWFGLLLGACGEEVAIKVESLPNDAIEVPPEVLRESAAGRRPFAATTSVLYLHFDGLTITKSNYKSDASLNASFIGGGAIPAFVGDQATRDQVVGLVRELYAAYNIQVVTTRPTSGNYTMAVIGGRPAHLGLNWPLGVIGVAPMDCDSLMPRDIAFVFSDSIKILSPNSYAKVVAETTAHESAHTYGLPHSNYGCDLMSYGTCSQVKRFLDKTMGMQDATNNCGMSSMNSHQLLLQALGPASSAPPPPTEPPADTTPPAVVITSPQNGATVPAAGVVKATATDNSGGVRAELVADGKVVATRSAGPFEFSVNLSPGAHLLTVNAYDVAGNKGSASVNVTVAEQSTAPAAPPSGSPGSAPEGPAAEGAEPPPTDAVPHPFEPRTFGSGCDGPSDCDSGLCAEDPVSGGRYCTETCDPTESACPFGATCETASGGATVCSAPATLSAEGGTPLVGSCAVVTGSDAALASLWPALLALFVLGAGGRSHRRRR